MSPKSPDPNVPSIRMFGTTWADRGWRYWTRRFWIALLWTSVAAWEIVMVLGVWSGLFSSTDSRTAKFAISAVLGSLLFGGLVWAIKGWRDWRRLFRTNDLEGLRDLAAKGGRDRSKGARWGTLLGAGGLAGIPVAGLALLVGIFATVGWVFVVLLMSFGRYYTAEEYLAVRELERARARSR